MVDIFLFFVHFAVLDPPYGPSRHPSLGSIIGILLPMQIMENAFRSTFVYGILYELTYYAKCRLKSWILLGFSGYGRHF